MTFLEPIILGIIQGITEWLPISSEGITSLVMVQFFNKTLTDAVYYAIWLHLGTVLAALVYFRKDVTKILQTAPEYIKKPKKYKLTHFLVISTILTGIIGGPLLLYGLTKTNFSGEPALALIGLCLLLTGGLQLLKKKKTALHKQPTTKFGVITGALQGLAVLPGLSRSGITVAALLFLKYDPKEALKLSFLMSIPIVLVAQVGLGLLGKITFDAASFVAILISFVVGLLTLKVFLNIAERVNFGIFCILLGLLSLIPLLF